MLTDEQVKSIKNQIIEKIEASFPEGKKELAKKRMESMSSAELEEFLVKNNLAISNTPSQEALQHCVFCSIVSGGIESHKISENENAIAVLEINPISKGHVLIIPKEHSLTQGEEHEKSIKKLIKNVSNTIKKKLKPKSITTYKSNLFGHETINVIPQYNNETADSEKHSATQEELLGVRALLMEKQKKALEKQPKKTKIKTEEKVWLPRRIP